MSNLKKRRSFFTEALPNYVRDGLVLWLDGDEPLLRINAGAEKEGCVWRDSFVSGQGAEMESVSQLNGGVVFDGTAGWGIIGNTEPVALKGILKGLKNRTLEVVCRLDDAESVQTLIIGYGYTANTDIGAAGLWYRPASKAFKVGTWDNSPTVPIDNVTKRASYSIVYGDSDLTDFRFFKNGIEFAQGDTSGNMYSAAVTVGARKRNDGYGQYRLKGEICCIRLYNRKLTDAERLQNYTIDKRRFGIDAG